MCGRRHRAGVVHDHHHAGQPVHGRDPQQQGPHAEDAMRAHTVSTAVNSPRNNEARLISPSG